MKICLNIRLGIIDRISELVGKFEQIINNAAQRDTKVEITK